MINCKLCNKEFKTNAGGDLTKHLVNDHNISLAEYVIKTEYNEITHVVTVKVSFCLPNAKFNRKLRNTLCTSELVG